MDTSNTIITAKNIELDQDGKPEFTVSFGEKQARINNLQARTRSRTPRKETKSRNSAGRTHPTHVLKKVSILMTKDRSHQLPAIYC